MKGRILAYLMAMLLLGAPCAGGDALASPGPYDGGVGPAWETVSVTSQPELANTSIDAEARDGYIYVTTAQPVEVKVFSIVGQLIARQKLPAGTSRLKVAKRGIYILKAGDRTLRVTI